MIAFHLIFISLIVAIACENSHPLVFFAEIDASFIPLSYTSEETNGMEFSVLSFSKSSGVPVEFELQNEYAITKNTYPSSALGFFGGKVAFGPDIASKSLEFDEQSKVLNNRFYLCRYQDKHFYELTYGDSHREANLCFRAELYLLPYDKETKTVDSKAFKPKNHHDQKGKPLSKEKKKRYICRELDSDNDISHDDFTENIAPHSREFAALEAEKKHGYVEHNRGEEVKLLIS